LHNPNGMTKYSWCPKWVEKAVFWMSASCILIWWYPNLRSNLENRCAPFSSSKRSSMIGIGKKIIGSLRPWNQYIISKIYPSSWPAK
jgi:hypothetical protein